MAEDLQDAVRSAIVATTERVRSAIVATTERMESVLPMQACNEATIALEMAIESRDVSDLRK